MLIYKTNPNFDAARNIGSYDVHEQRILDTIGTFNKFNKRITADNIRIWIKRKYGSQLSHEIIAEYLSLYVAIDILNVRELEII